jgi:UDP-N-acetylglucosamine--N-acetylmuramyl-(pentapeptide) pyrophosphoryl-undecaprenol N-acetylglucosamine transferase
MELAYAVADLIVARAGATTVAEVTVCGLPAMLIPYPYATARHQEANARALQRAGGATIVMDDALSGDLLAGRIADLVDDRERLRRMADRSAAWGRPDAAETLAEAVTEAAKS